VERQDPAKVGTRHCKVSPADEGVELLFAERVVELCINHCQVRCIFANDMVAGVETGITPCRACLALALSCPINGVARISVAALYLTGTCAFFFDIDLRLKYFPVVFLIAPQGDFLGCLSARAQELVVPFPEFPSQGEGRGAVGCR
jgi:hypothetical protein